jgi:DNA end-binding protein Ku
LPDPLGASNLDGPPEQGRGSDAAVSDWSTMARGIWKGSISFGLVEVPVSLHSCAKSEEIRFTQLDKRNFSPIGYRRYNKESGEEVAWADIVRGYEYEDGKYAVLTDQDLKRADPKATRTIEILQFVDVADIEPVFYETPYYVAPQHANSRAYALLRDALQESGKAGVARVVLHTRDHLGALLVRKNLLVLDLLRYAHEVKSPSEIEMPEQDEKALRLKPAELQMAVQLIEGMSEPWKPEKFTDEYRDAVLAMVKQKVKAGKTAEIDESEPETPKTRAEVYDLMPLLKKSLAAGPAKRGPARREKPEKESAAPTGKRKRAASAGRRSRRSA